MKKLIYNALIAAIAVMTASCGDSSIPTFDDEYTAVRFAGVYPDPDYGNNSGNITRYNFSFVDQPQYDTYLFEIPVYVSGNALSKDTNVNYEIDTENTTAPVGSYEIVSAVIPAGERNGTITVRINKTAELQGEVSYTLVVRLLPSDELMTGDSRYLTGMLTWSNNLPLPPHNNLIRTYHMLIAGEANFVSTSAANITTNGLSAIVGALGWNDWDDPEAHPGQANNNATYAYYKYLPRYTYIYATGIYVIYSRMVGEWLQEYEKEHGAPLLHNGGKFDGQPVKARYN